MCSRHPSCSQNEPQETSQREAKHAAMNHRERRWGSEIGDVCRWNPRLFWSETKVAIRQRFASQRHASSALSILLTTDNGSFYPLAPALSTCALIELHCHLV